MSWSGGKDAAWALHELQQRDDIEVVALLSTLTEGYERSSMQGVRREVLLAQADAAGLPLLEAWIPQTCNNAFNACPWPPDCVNAACASSAGSCSIWKPPD